jgi:hypothetical protein
MGRYIMICCTGVTVGERNSRGFTEGFFKGTENDTNWNRTEEGYIFDNVYNEELGVDS